MNCFISFFFFFYLSITIIIIIIQFYCIRSLFCGLGGLLARRVLLFCCIFFPSDDNIIRTPIARVNNNVLSNSDSHSQWLNLIQITHDNINMNFISFNQNIFNLRSVNMKEYAILLWYKFSLQISRRLNWLFLIYLKLDISDI